MNLWIWRKPKQTICIPKLLIKDVWMFLQHRATCRCRRPRVEQTIAAVGELPPPHPDRTVPRPIKGGSYWCNHVVTLIMPSEIVSMCCLMYCTACLHDNIRIRNRASFIFFGASTLLFLYFVFYLRSVIYTALYKLNFQKWQNWKFTSQGVSLTILF